MKTRIVSYSILIALCFASCARAFDEDGFSKSYESIKSLNDETQLLNGLLSLDQSYPDMLQVKIDLGTFFLLNKDFEKARPFLTRAMTILDSSQDDSLKALACADYAEFSLRTGEYADAVSYAGKSLAFDSSDPIGVVFTKAKGEYALEKREEALADFKRGLELVPSKMLPEDYSVYAKALGEAEKYTEAIALIETYEKAYPYATGFGLLASVCYEKLGKLDESVLSAFKEMEFQRAYNDIPKDKIIGNLDSLMAKIPESPKAEKTRGIIACLKSYVNEKWDDVVEGMRELSGSADTLFFNYLRYSALLESGNADDVALREYAKLETNLSNLPSYYLHYWHGMKKSVQGYGFSNIKGILEKCVLLAQASSAAIESRIEIGRLIGLSDVDSKKLLLAEETSALIETALGKANPDGLSPILGLLSLPDNEYQVIASELLKSIAASEPYTSYLRAKRDEATGRFKDRLQYVLANVGN